MFGGHHIGPFNKYITYDTQTLFAERRGKFLRFQGGEKGGGVVVAERQPPRRQKIIKN